MTKKIFPWQKSKKTPVYSYDDLAAEMNRRFNEIPGNVKYTPPTTAKLPKKIRVVGKTGYK